MTYPDLNRWSAEKVMGWVHDPYGPVDRWDMAPFMPHYEDQKGKFQMMDYDWRPLIDCNQLKMVIERMQELGWEIKISGLLKPTKDYVVVFRKPEDFLNLGPWQDNPDLNTAVLMAAYGVLNVNQ